MATRVRGDGTTWEALTEGPRLTEKWKHSCSFHVLCLEVLLGGKIHLFGICVHGLRAAAELSGEGECVEQTRGCPGYSECV